VTELHEMNSVRIKKSIFFLVELIIKLDQIEIN